MRDLRAEKKWTVKVAEVKFSSIKNFLVSRVHFGEENLSYRSASSWHIL